MTYLRLTMMKYADSWHAQHTSKQLRCAGQAPAWIFTVTSVWNTGETGNNYDKVDKIALKCYYSTTLDLDLELFI